MYGNESNINFEYLFLSVSRSFILVLLSLEEIGIIYLRVFLFNLFIIPY